MDRRPDPQISMHDCCEDDEDSDEIELAPKINTYKEVNEYSEKYSTFLKAEGMQWKLLK